jgi:GNAT superfamily N-acetyltransferase
MQSPGRSGELRMTIRPLRPEDRAEWEALWTRYHAHGPFGGRPPAAVITEKTWNAFLAHEPMEALVAVEDGRMVGLIHMVFHPVTDEAGPACFLNDLFVADDMRRRGIGRRLIEALYVEAKARGAERVYWHMQVDNERARRFYDSVAAQSGHTVYRKVL